MSIVLVTHLFSLFMIHVSYADDEMGDAACAGKAFPALCSVMLVMKKDIDDNNALMLNRFEGVIQMFTDLKDQKVAKQTIDSEVRALTKIQATGIRMVTKEMEKRIDSLTASLKYQIRESMHELDLRTEDVLKFTHRDVVKLRDEVVTQFQTNGNIYRNSLNKAESIVMENKNITEKLVHSQTLGLEQEIDKRVFEVKNTYFKGYTSLNRQIGNKIIQTHKTLIDMQEKVRVMDTPGWNPGSYCILADGRCPAGFTSVKGEMKGISMFSSNSTYLEQSMIGNSKIGCFGSCGDREPWFGELIISACCK